MQEDKEWEPSSHHFNVQDLSESIDIQAHMLWRIDLIA